MTSHKLSPEAHVFAQKVVSAQQVDIPSLLDSLRDPVTWVNHLCYDLLKFWGKPELRKLNGPLFRSYITHDGRWLPTDRAAWPSEYLSGLVDDETRGLLADANYDFVRAHSRQTFAYGIAYHMTGDPQWLDLCKMGCQALINSFDDANGSMYTLCDANTGQWIDNPQQRTSQDLAYGMTGMAFYYYLTHDPKALQAIDKLWTIIFEKYYDPGKDIFTWLPKSVEDNNQIEIVSQMDQIYGYMAFLMPSLPGEKKEYFRKELHHIASILIERFYSEIHGTFWGACTSSAMKVMETDHTDFGHSVKAFWLIHQIGIWTGDTHFVTFAREKIDAILESAFDPDTGTWCRRFNRDGSLDRRKEWWALAELDQAASILALNDPSYLRYLNPTYSYWLNKMVDMKNGEIWHMIENNDEPNLKYPKAHCWKTSFHSFEHALFAYITTSQIKGVPFNLHYAFTPDETPTYQQVSPYLFKGNIRSTDRRSAPITNLSGKALDQVIVTFDCLH